jgi:superfamily II DNA helicase RecQ
MWIRELATGWERVYKPSEHASASVTRGTRDAVPTRTQFVYLTATLPPTMQAMFEEQNNLVNPKVIRASTNRRNLFYIVQQATRPGSLLEEGARKARDA